MSNPTTIAETITDKFWILYGTVGCRLCDDAKYLLNQAQMVADFEWRYVDIIDLPEDEMLALATKIPVIQTPNFSQTLNYPFFGDGYFGINNVIDNPFF